MAGWIEIENLQSPVTAPCAITMDKRIPPCVGHAVYSPDYESDERPGDYLETRREFVGVPRAFGASRYPNPQRADLVTLWKRGVEPVLSITADGKVHDFHLPPARLVVLLREVADLLADNTILK